MKYGNIGELISTDGLRFYNGREKLDTNISDYGKYNWGLIDHIFSQSSSYLTLKGNGLEDFLNERQNLHELTETLVQFWSKQTSAGKDMVFHVDVDIEKINKFYKSDKILIQEGLSEKILNMQGWIQTFSEFERQWNIYLCDSIGGFVGYPGYELPNTELAFKCAVSHNATWFMVGNYVELERYRKYPYKSKGYSKDIEKNLKKFILKPGGK